MIYYLDMQSPIGDIILQANQDGLVGVWFSDRLTQSGYGKYSDDHPVLLKARQQLQEYFDGTRQVFDIPLAAQGTNFQAKVWQALSELPFAKTASYQDIADKIENPKAVRAVGLANSKNPISIIVPCHRVIAKNGNLTGYAGGLERKAWLLEHEQSG